MEEDTMEVDTMVDIMEVIMEADIMEEDTTVAGENNFQEPYQLFSVRGLSTTLNII